MTQPIKAIVAKCEPEWCKVRIDFCRLSSDFLVCHTHTHRLQHWKDFDDSSGSSECLVVVWRKG